ncbi:Ltp family lipoprotein [Arthrobacter sp. NPDC080073]|uniref:Ltp family lipoprotein n=1 Tax=Arthrobacter sp. NPDC080073 TaxID=3155919 RepID=UPI00341B40AC
MKRYLSAVLAATLVAGLTACGGGVSQASSSSGSASSSSSGSASPSASPTKTSRPVPDVAGKTFAEAYKVLSAAGFYGSAYGKDGKKWTHTTPDASIVVVSTNPAAGTVSATEDIEIHVGITEAEHAAVAKAAADAKKAAADAAAKAAAAPKVPTEYSSALSKAGSYSRNMHMSKAGIYDQLTSQYGEKFSPEAAQYAVDNLKTDYNANALAKAKSYQSSMSMSPAAIYDQLVSQYGEKFTPEEANYAVQNLN